MFKVVISSIKAIFVYKTAVEARENAAMIAKEFKGVSVLRMTPEEVAYYNEQPSDYTSANGVTVYKAVEDVPAWEPDEVEVERVFAGQMAYREAGGI